MSDAFDLIVVGTGAGGSPSALKCSAAGWRVAVVDDQPYGGTCANRGCDPKKVLVGGAALIDWHRRSGATPVPLDIPGEEHVRTSTDFLDLDALPPRIAFIGAGYISLEFAHIVQRAGSQAIVLGRSDPLVHFDQDLVRRLVAHTTSAGVDFRTGSSVTAIEKSGSAYRVSVGTGAATTVVDVDLVVHGAGRVPGTKQLDLAMAQVGADKHGAILVNEFMQSTTNPRVYAAGDCTLPPGALPLTPVAAHEGMIVASNLLQGNTKRPDYRGIPSVVFTEPPLAMVGLTEAEARQQGRDIRVKCEDTASWFANRRVQEPAAMYKTIVDTNTDHILGAHLLGPDAADVINIFALAVRHGLTASDLRHMKYAYPTSSSDISYMV